MRSAETQQRALVAARVVAQREGLECADAVIAYSGSNVIVHLRPAPVVARVMTGTVVLHGDPRVWLSREIALLRWLAPTGLAVRPSPLMAPGPVCHDGLWMTFLEWIPDATSDGGQSPARSLGGALRALHDALGGYAGELAGMGDLRDDIHRLHGLLSRSDDALTARLHALDGLFLDPGLPVQALHGDASLRNLLRTPGGGVWNDFEDALRGPVHWDLAGYVSDTRAAGLSVADLLDGYGWGEESSLEPFLAAHDVYDEIWRRYVRQERSAD